jgi:hypothetical protein
VLDLQRRRASFHNDNHIFLNVPSGPSTATRARARARAQVSCHQPDQPVDRGNSYEKVGLIREERLVATPQPEQAKYDGGHDEDRADLHHLPKAVSGENEQNEKDRWNEEKL